MKPEMISITLDQITISRDPLLDVDVPEELGMKLAQTMEAEIMRAAGMGRVPQPTTLYVDKYGRFSTVDPNAPQHTYYRPGFGWIVSS